MDEVTKINITQEDLAQAYASGFADGSVVRDQTAVSAEQYEKLQRSFTTLTLSNSSLKKDHERLIAEHNRLADTLAFIQQLIDIRYTETRVDDFLGQFFDAVKGRLDDLGEVSPF